MTLLEIRNNNNISQLEAASIIGIPVRTYRRYETDNNYGSELKRKAFIDIFLNKFEVSEEKGVLSIESIKKQVVDLFDDEYNGLIDFCYLFGSYAKGIAKDTSDVDLYISCSLSGLKFVGLIERVRQVLHKKIDMLRSSEIVNNVDLMNEIMKEGIKIYG